MADIANAVVTTAGTAGLPISELGNFLKYGAPGLALAVLVVAYFSLNAFQKQALEGKVSAERMAPFERLQRLYLIAALAMICLAVLAPPVLARLGPPDHAELHVSFSLSPAEFDSNDWVPMLVPTDNGIPIGFVHGTAQDKLAKDRTYQINVGKLVRTLIDLQASFQRQQLGFERTAGGPDANTSNR